MKSATAAAVMRALIVLTRLWRRSSGVSSMHGSFGDATKRALCRT
jgi:hypothetical protein